MKRATMVAASVLALAWGTARAEVTAQSSPSGAKVTATDAAGSSATAETPAPADTAPPDVTTDPTATDANARARATAPLPTDPNAPNAASDANRSAATTNIEINTPPPVNNTVVTPPPPAPVQPVAPAPAYTNAWEGQRAVPRARNDVGAGLLLGGGVQDFTGSNARSVTGTAGYWNARLVFGSRQIVGFEAAYIGSAQSINMLGLNSDAVLVSNGAEGALRLNLPVAKTTVSFVEPFGFVGAGWSRYHVANTPVNTSSVAPNDDILEVPYGAGLAFGYRGFMADARFTYRSTFYNDLLRTMGGSLDNWTAAGQVGFEF